MTLPLISYLLIPLSTLMLVSDTKWFTSNFSVISIAYSRQGLFLLWSIIVGLYFHYCIKQILRQMSRSMDIKKEKRLLKTASILFVLAVLFPYLPGSLPLLSASHVLCALFASVLLLLCVIFICLKLYFKSPSGFRSFLIGLIWICVFSTVLFFPTGIINSAMEIFFTMALTFLVKNLYDKTVLKS